MAVVQRQHGGVGITGGGFEHAQVGQALRTDNRAQPGDARGRGVPIATVQPEFDVREGRAQLPHAVQVVTGTANGVEVGDVNRIERTQRQQRVQHGRWIAVGAQACAGGAVARAVSTHRAHDLPALEIEYRNQVHARYCVRAGHLPASGGPPT